MWLTVNGPRSRALKSPHVNSPCVGFQTQMAELTAVNSLSPELEARFFTCYLEIIITSIPAIVGAINYKWKKKRDV